MRSLSLTVAVSALTSFLAMSQTDAGAAVLARTFPAMNCVSFQGQTPLTQMSNGQLVNTKTGIPNFVNFLCPVVADVGSSNPVADPRLANSVFLTGYAGPDCTSGGISYAIGADPCRTFATGFGGACSSGFAHSNFSFNTVISPSVAPGTGWTAGTASDSYYLYMGIQGTCSGSSSVLFSYGFN